MYCVVVFLCHVVVCCVDVCCVFVLSCMRRRSVFLYLDVSRLVEEHYIADAVKNVNYFHYVDNEVRSMKHKLKAIGARKAIY